jgi:hypothetical protein
MRRTAVIRLSLAIVLPVAIATACNDNPISGVNPGNNPSLGSGSSGSGSSGSGTNTQGSQSAADTFSLLVHVTVRPTTGDTLRGTPVAGATATLTKTEWTFIHGNGGDTMSGHTVTVGSKTTDANGDALFDHLSPDLYHVTATRPGALDSSPATSVELINVAKAFVPIVLRPLP